MSTSEATDPLLASSCLDFLLIELVPLSFRLSRGLEPVPPPSGPDLAPSDEASSRSGPPPHRLAASSASGAGPARRLDDDDQLEAVHLRLDSVGYRVGQGLAERFSRDRPRFNETLDVIKFLCKDLWSLLFGKNIDNLKTNHRGVYVLTDNLFRPFSRMSTEAGGQAVVRAQPFLWFPCGIVRGALAALGIKATVQAEISQLPTAVFQIKTLSTKP